MSKLFHAWRRQWKLTVVLVAAALAVIAYALGTLPRAYQGGSSVIMLAPRAGEALSDGNPYLSFSPSLTLTADAVAEELMAPSTVEGLAARGFGASYTVALANYTTNTTGSALTVTVTGNDKAGVQSTLRGVTAEISAKLAQLQDNVAPRHQIHAATLSYTPQPAINASQTARKMIVATFPVALLALVLPLLVDGRLERRRLRRAAGPSATPDPDASPARPRAERKVRSPRISVAKR